MLLNINQNLKFESPLVGRLHIGTVMDNNDPKGLQRLRVSLPRLTEGLPTEHLPWYSVKQPIGVGGGRTSSFSVPEVGTTVTVSFYSEDIYAGIVDGILITEQNNQVNAAMMNVRPDLPPDFRTYTPNMPKANTESEGIVSKSYPESYGHVDSTGNWSRVDKKQNSIEMVHSSGSSFNIDRDGNVSIHITGSLTLIVDKDVMHTCINTATEMKGNNFTRIEGSDTKIVAQTKHTEVGSDLSELVLANKQVEVNGSYSEITDGNKNIEVNSSLIEAIAANKQVDVGANSSIAVGGTKVSVTSGDDTIRASNIYLN